MREMTDKSLRDKFREGILELLKEDEYKRKKTDPFELLLESQNKVNDAQLECNRIIVQRLDDIVTRLIFIESLISRKGGDW